MAPRHGRLDEALLGQRGYLFPWTPVCLGTGIGTYFALRWEPSVWLLIACGVAGLLGLLAQRRLGAVWGALLVAVSLLAAGFALAGGRAHWVAGSQLDFRYYGAVEGRVVNIDRSASDAVRVTLDRVVLSRVDPEDTPHRVRVSLHGNGGSDPAPGAVVLMTAHLGPPGGAVEPGGFDFRRHAWFLGLGGVGYTRLPVLLLEPPEHGQWVFKARMALSARVQAGLPGEAGAFAAAVTTGDRSGMSQETLQDLRDTNLAHLLAISGLHMGLLAGFVFAALRLGLLLIPATRHRWPVKKIAAGGALVAAFFYLLLSGGNVATERAFIMAAVALCALMLDRRGISLRAVAMAALIVLVWQPEALISPGFQMSFAATTALVAVFEFVTRHRIGRDWPRWTAPVLSLVLSSAVAGFATAPVAMVHFNQMAHYGLIANLISVPVMGFLIIPMAVVAALLMPFGLEVPALWVMGLGLDWILFVAETVGAWEGAVRGILAPPAPVLPLLALGGLMLALWQGRGRLAGLAPLLVAALVWVQSDRPALLVAETGGLVGVMTDAGRALSRDKGAGFVAEVWLENDGSRETQGAAAARWPGVQGRVAETVLGPFRIRHVQGKTGASAIDDCAADEIVIADTALDLQGDCLLLDAERLRRTGAVAFRLRGEALHMTTAAEAAGHRLWHGADPPPLQVAQSR